MPGKRDDASVNIDRQMNGPKVGLFYRAMFKHA